MTKYQNTKFILPAIIVLLFTRLIGLSWGLPYALHPDEMNMVIAITNLQCPSLFDISNCMNPHFFAYGQLPLYIGYVLVWIMKFFDGDLTTAMSYSEATIALRFIAAICSLITVWFMGKIIWLLSLRPHANGRDNLDEIASSPIKNKLLAMTFFIIAIFTPGLIQFAHFGTTESILMACYTAITYYLINTKNKDSITPLLAGFQNDKSLLLKLGVIAGVAIATKVSSILFIITIVAVYVVNSKTPKLSASASRRRDGQNSKTPKEYRDCHVSFDKLRILAMTKKILMLFAIVAISAIILSPHNFISWTDFMNSMGYESAVGVGNVKVFYTNQFENTVPVIFQFLHIFPFSLGFWQVLTFIIGFVALPYNRHFNVLRLAFLIFFIPSAFFYAKWVRFVAPAMPVMLIFSVYCTTLIYSKLKKRINGLLANIYLVLVLGFVMFQGIQFVSIYINPDIRFEASEWINRHIPQGSFILSEERNVANTPIKNENGYRIVNFDFYDYADDKYLEDSLKDLVKKADYIIVPSRRVWANYANEKYPHIKKYYQDLNSGHLGFRLIREFKPTLLDDEMAEETFSVFDHPTIRIYQKF